VAIPPTSTTAQYNANNQVRDGSLGYDPAGNVTADNANSYLYDGEGRICAVYQIPIAGVGGLMTEYIYDAEGNRVAKGTITSWSCDSTLNSNGVPNNGFIPTNSYVVGLGNEQLTETDGNGNWKHTNVYAAGALIATYDADPTSGTQALHFQLADWLGSRRVQTDYAGNIEETCTSLPFGNALNCPTTSLSTADDATEHHFTGKERDTESGNDYFGARYYASSMGRFMSPDWSAQEEPVPYAKLDNPQTLNLYAYVGNNPLRTVDADGHEGAVLDEIEAAAEEGAMEGEEEGEPAGPEGAAIGAGIGALLGLADLGWGVIHDHFQSKPAAAAPKPAAAPAQQEDKKEASPEPQTSTSGGQKGTGGKNGLPPDVTKLKGNQGYKDKAGNTWKKDTKHKDHWDVSDKKGNKVKEVTFDGKQLWPDGPKNKNK
jgi:RHS repeat-associated protein